MASSLEIFSSIEASPISHILMGNNTIMPVYEKGSIGIQDGTFNDVLYVPSLSTNLLSIYQIILNGSGQIVEFSPNSVFIWDSVIDDIVAIGTIDHSIYLYTFSNFGPSSPFLEHSSSISQEHHVGQPGHMNLCVVPETTSMTTTTPLVGVSSLQ